MESQNNFEKETFSTDGKKDYRMKILLPVLAFLFFVLLAAQNYFQLGDGGAIWKMEKKATKTGQDATLMEKLKDQTKIRKFSDYAELQTFLEDNSSSGDFGRGGMFDSFSASSPLSAMEKSVQAPLGMGGADYSETNVQVAGVDEADLVKTDGTHIYSVAGKTLFITKAYPADGAEVESKIEFKSNPKSIYLKGKRLVIFGGDQEIMTMDYYSRFKRKSPYSFLKVFDISDKKNPKQIRDLDFEGNYLDSRMIDGYLYFVTSTHSQYYAGEIPVPRILESGKEIYNSLDLTKCSNCPEVFYFDVPYDSINMVNVAAINIEDEGVELNNQVYLLSGQQNFYASKNNIYIAYTKYLSEYDLFMGMAKELLFSRLAEKDQERIEKIEESADFILNDNEKLEKISIIVENFLASLSDEESEKVEEELMAEMEKRYVDISKELEKTVIHKIAIDKHKIKYETFGEVTGSVLNQFSMDEDEEGNFRIATTKNQNFAPLYFFNRFGMENPRRMTSEQDQKMRVEQNQSYSNLYVLNDALKTIGSVENLAKGERIYSVRFMQKRAYLVTFKQTDPLFVIDLKDAKNPQVLGELKVPGFSNYLHPYDETTLIGLGRETEENSSGGVITKGLKLSLFDVSDVSHPREIDKYELGSVGSDSLAIRDHKAFLFSREKNLLVIPATLTNDSLGNLLYRREAFNGAVVFSVEKNGFELKGKISQNINSDRDYYNSGLKRALYIDNNLYTVSDQYLQINSLDNLDLVKKIALKGEEDFRVVPGREPMIEPITSIDQSAPFGLAE